MLKLKFWLDFPFKHISKEETVVLNITNLDHELVHLVNPKVSLPNINWVWKDYVNKFFFVSLCESISSTKGPLHNKKLTIMFFLSTTRSPFGPTKLPCHVWKCGLILIFSWKSWRQGDRINIIIYYINIYNWYTNKVE